MQEDRLEFYRHYQKWDDETFFKSSLNEIFSHPDYKAIVKMGKRAVPFIVEVLERQPDYIVQALADIKGYKPKVETSLVSDLCKKWLKILK